MIRRREILRGAPVAATAALVGVGVAAQSSEIQSLYAQWRKMKISGEGGMEEDEMERLLESMRKLETEILEIEAFTASDLAIKLTVVTDDFDFQISGGPHAEVFKREIVRLAA